MTCLVIVPTTAQVFLLGVAMLLDTKCATAAVSSLSSSGCLEGSSRSLSKSPLDNPSREPSAISW